MPQVTQRGQSILHVEVLDNTLAASDLKCSKVRPLAVGNLRNN